MSSEAVNKINAAVRAGLRRCYGSEDLVTPLAQFMLHLRADPSWTEEETNRVEVTIRRMLNEMVTEP